MDESTVTDRPVTIDDFARLELRVAKVLSVEPHPKADRLYVLRIDGGEERQIVAGVRPFMTPDELEGRSIVVVWNLAPAMIRGVESRGMMLAGQHGETIGVLGPQPELPPGTRVR
ncbi:MAG: methionine--tRNA ligase subunit beta [Planctomycetes bacterium]|nr:methionine--tRNA ligase subunit beta [Planctomycetota bacterium]